MGAHYLHDIGLSSNGQPPGLPLQNTLHSYRGNASLTPPSAVILALAVLGERLEARNSAVSATTPIIVGAPLVGALSCVDLLGVLSGSPLPPQESQ